MNTYKNKHLIIPVHPPKFAYLFNGLIGLKDSGKHSDTFLTLVTTSEIEKESLLNYISIYSPRIPMDYEIISAASICTEYGFNKTLDCIIINNNNGIVNFKKMTALYRALDIGAKEIICLDADVLFFTSIDAVFDKLRENFTRKQVIAGHSVHAGPIVIDTANLLQTEEKDKILDIYDNGKLYSWFFDAPFYPQDETLR